MPTRARVLPTNVLLHAGANTQDGPFPKVPVGDIVLHFLHASKGYNAGSEPSPLFELMAQSHNLLPCHLTAVL